MTDLNGIVAHKLSERFMYKHLRAYQLIIDFLVCALFVTLDGMSGFIQVSIASGILFTVQKKLFHRDTANSNWIVPLVGFAFGLALISLFEEFLIDAVHTLVGGGGVDFGCFRLTACLSALAIWFS